MKKHTYSMIYEAKERTPYKPYGKSPRDSAINVHKDSGDLYNGKKKSTIFKSKFDTAKSKGDINSIAAAFARYFKKFAESHNNSKASIKRLKLDDRHKGALGLANLFLRLVNDAMSDANGNVMSLHDPDSFNMFKSRLMKQLRETSPMYPILFMVGREILSGNDSIRGSASLVKWLNAAADELDVASMSNVYKQKEGLDSASKKVSKKVDLGPTLTYVNRYMEALRSKIESGDIEYSDILGSNYSEFLNNYFGDSDEDSDEPSDDSVIDEFKEEMKQAVVDNKNSDNKKFVRGSEQEPIVDKWVDKLIDGDFGVFNNFVDAVFKTSIGSSPAFTIHFYDKVIDKYGPEMARAIKARADGLTNTRYEDPKPSPIIPSKEKEDDDDVKKLPNYALITDTMRNTETENEFLKKAKAMSKMDFTTDELRLIMKELTDRYKNGPGVEHTRGRGNSAPMSRAMLTRIMSAMDLNAKVAAANSAAKTKTESISYYIDNYLI